MNNCAEVISTGCITWSGKTIPCLGIKQGDCLTETVYHITNKICQILEDIDMSDLDIHCLLGYCKTCPNPNDGHIKTILQLLLDNQCTLKELIDNINVNPTASTDLTGLNLKCLQKYDDGGNPIETNLVQSLQLIINELCSHKTDITNIKNDIVILNDKIDSIPTPTPYVEPSITTCVTNGAKKVSVAVPVIATALCDLRSIVGEDDDVNDALAAKCTIGGKTYTQMFATTSGWVLNPTNVAQALNNMWIVTCNALSRLDEIESNCCAPSCDKLKIGFISEFEDNTVILKFTPGAGTLIPTGYTDCGSELTITDDKGTTFSILLPIAQGYISDPIDLSLFEKNSTLHFNIMLKMCNDSLSCEKCINKDVKYESGCCVLTNTGSTDIVVMYSSPQNQIN